ncbi:hypothetical protein ACSBR2_026710 [Camellia fascicularis]
MHFRILLPTLEEYFSRKNYSNREGGSVPRKIDQLSEERSRSRRTGTEIGRVGARGGEEIG